MRKSIKYRQGIAAVLLAVYAFITCPVQLWHYHPVEENVSAKKGSAKQLAIAKGNASADDCLVCSHRYSAYSNYYYSIAIASHAQYAAMLSDGKTSLCQAFVWHCSNKGPPFIA